MPSDIADRIRLLLQNLNLNPLEFAREAGITNSIIYEALNDNRKIGLSSLLKISERWGISLNWLILGLGPVLLKDMMMPHRNDAVDIYAQNHPISDTLGLKDILLDRDLTDSLHLTGEEVQELLPLIKGEEGWALRSLDKYVWLRIIYNIRKEKLDRITEAIDNIQNKK